MSSTLVLIQCLKDVVSHPCLALAVKLHVYHDGSYQNQVKKDNPELRDVGSCVSC